MNIFKLSECPRDAAVMMCNKHIIKMPLETMGMMMYAFPENFPPINNSYANRHYMHPASVWARTSLENFNWLLEHGKYLCNEYKTRYKRTHYAEEYIDWIDKNMGMLSFSKRDITPFARCFSSYKEKLDSEIPNTVEAYREFYKLDKISFAKWPSLDTIPFWWDQKEEFVDKSFTNGIYNKR